MLINVPRIPIREIILIGLLPNFIKKFAYRLRGYKIGKNVSIGFLSVIIGDLVWIGDNTTISHLTIIRGKKIRIGSYVSIGATTILDTPHLEIGDGAKINEQVFVGGMEFPESKLILGKNTTVMQLTYINTAKPVIVGDDSGIGGHCLLFSHGSWLSQFEGYPVQFAPIEIGRSVWLPWRIFVMPGAKIGDGSVIGANSLVSGEIPPKSLAAGSPAKVIRKAPDFPLELSEEKKVRILKNILNEMVKYFGFYGIVCKKVGNTYNFTKIEKRVLGTRRKNLKMKVYDEDDTNKQDVWSGDHFDLYLSLKSISQEIRKLLVSKGIMWIDIDNKERSNVNNDLGDEVALFFTRYGVRLNYVN